MTKIKSMAVFCGAADGNNPAYIKGAHTLGKIMAENGVDLVYGAGHVGMMGAVAKSVLDAGGRAIGVINKTLNEREEQTFLLTDLILYPSLHERKDAMYAMSDAFCILPGGIGTMDELSEIMTLKQIGDLNKPIILFNIAGFWDPFRIFIDRLISEGYLKPEYEKLVTYIDRAEDILPTAQKEIDAIDNKK